MKIQYNAIFEYEQDGINITFPDIPNAFTCAYSRDEAIEMAKEVLDIVLHGMHYENLPVVSSKDEIKIGANSEVVEIEIEMGIKDDVLFGYNVIELI